MAVRERHGEEPGAVCLDCGCEEAACEHFCIGACDQNGPSQSSIGCRRWLVLKVFVHSSLGTTEERELVVFAKVVVRLRTTGICLLGVMSSILCIETRELQVVIYAAPHEVTKRWDEIGDLENSNTRPYLVGFFDSEAYMFWSIKEGTRLSILHIPSVLT